MQDSASDNRYKDTGPKSNAFKASEKLYKACSSVDEALALGAIDFTSACLFPAITVNEVRILDKCCQAYTIAGYEGAYVISQALHRRQQVELVYNALKESLAPPNRTNLHCHYAPEQIETDLQDIWSKDGPKLDEFDVCEESNVDDSPQLDAANIFIGADAISDISRKKKHTNSESREGPRLPSHLTLSKVRWATLGFQYDWTARNYNNAAYVPFPAQLGELARQLASACGAGFTIKPEAAIVNFYPLGQTMGGHVDDGEEALHCPVVSMSIGPSCIFLLGGATKDDTPIAVLLRSGDVLVLGGEARLKFHGVPKVFVSDGPPANVLPCTAGDEPIHCSGCPHFLALNAAHDGQTCSCGHVSVQEIQRALKVIYCCRVNINLRQVYKDASPVI